MTWTVRLTSDELNVVTNALKRSAETAGNGAYGKDFHLRLAQKISLESDFSGNRHNRHKELCSGPGPQREIIGEGN